tara:strand:+ start:13659 stop:14111 length:453 start_codon:yes stop_codon:yes gene_type:complete
MAKSNALKKLLKSDAATFIGVAAAAYAVIKSIGIKAYNNSENSPYYRYDEVYYQGESMPRIPYPRVVNAVERGTGLKFKAVPKLEVVESAQYLPIPNRIIVDYQMNNNRMKFYNALIHELVHAVRSQNGMASPHSMVFPVQHRIYSKLVL